MRLLISRRSLRPSFRVFRGQPLHASFRAPHRTKPFAFPKTLSHLVNYWRKFKNLWGVSHAEASHGQKRWRRIFQSAGSNAVGKVISAACSLLQVPIALQHLGTEAFGLWMTLLSTVAMLNFADLGMGLGMQNRISQAFGRDDVQKIREVFFTGFFLLAGVGGVLLLLVIPLHLAVDWAGLFKISNVDLAKQTPFALSIIYAAFCFSLPLSALQRLATGLQLGWLTSAATSLGSILSLVFVAVAATFKLSFIWFVALVVLPPLIVSMLLIPWLGPYLYTKAQTAASFDKSLVRPLLGTGAMFLVPQIASTVLISAPAVIISSILGSAAVTPYNLTQRLLGILTQFHGLFLGPLWPAYAEALSRGDTEWIKKTFCRSFSLTLGLLPIPCLVLALFGDKIIRAWSHYEGKIDSHFLVWMSLWLAAVSVGQACATFLNGLGRLTGQAIYGPLAVLAILLFLPALIGAYSLAGAGMALVIGYSSLNLPAQMAECAYSLKRLKRIAANQGNAPLPLRWMLNR